MQSSTLEFQSFDLDSPREKDDLTLINIENDRTASYNNRQDDDDGSPTRVSNESFWTFKYYQQFFDVNTEDVKSRIIWAMLPRPRRNYLEQCIKPYPDLYGPFWICTTLIFTIAVSGNVAKYLQSEGNAIYKYDFHLISTAAVVIFSYTWFVPLVLWAFIKWNSTNATITFLELLCVYGYSLAIYVPVSILWVIQISWFQWGMVMVGASLSALVLMSSVGPAVEGGKKIPVIAIMIALHFLLAVGFVEYFFQVPEGTHVPTPKVPIIVQPTMNASVAAKEHLNPVSVTSQPH